MIKKIILPANSNIKDAIKVLDSIYRNCLIVLNKDKQVIGTVTDGDIRRSFLHNLNINTKIEKVCNKKFIYFYKNNYNTKRIKKIFLSKDNNVSMIPILNHQKKLHKIFTKFDFQEKTKIYKPFKNVKVVIMAGGFGTRLKPATNILPKPLITIGNKTLIENIIDSFFEQGFKNFFVTLFHKKQLIKAYFQDVKKKYKLNFIEEKKPLGTAGSLSYLKNKSGATFLVTNCDNLVSVNFQNLYEFHKNNLFDLTLVGTKKNVLVPYGVLDLDKKKNFIKINEKPNYDFIINTGLYLIEKKIIKSIKINNKLDMNDLINISKKKGYKIGVYPLEEGSWIDIGQWSEYKKFFKKFDLK